MMYFAELRSTLSKTDSIQIILADDENEEIENYLTIDQVPNKYNLYEVRGIGNNDCIETDYGIFDKGIEIVLRKTPDFSSCTPNNINSTIQNMFGNENQNRGGLLKWISKLH